MKTTAVVHHSPLSTQLLDPTVIPCNGCASPKKDTITSLTLLAAIKALDTLQSGHIHPTQSLFNCAFHEEFESIAKKVFADERKQPSEKVKKEIFDTLVERIRLGSQHGGQCPATVSVIGSIASQEVIKGITHVYMPVSQFFLFESLDSLHDHPAESISGDFGATEAVYGAEIAEELRKMKVFVVGSGAIGCELLKNFAFLGVGAEGTDTTREAETSTLAEEKSDQQVDGSSGTLVVTDMDLIERSNLNRQLLFRQEHVGQAKALVAAAEATKLNPALNVRAYTEQLIASSEAAAAPDGYPFGSSFWQSLDVVVTALDNVAARKYVGFFLDDYFEVHWSLNLQVCG